MNNLIAVFIGGGFGSLVRYGISTITLYLIKTTFPVATLISNISSCIILATAVTMLNTKSEAETWKLLIITGFCGGFSTFSAFSYETVELIRSGNSMYAISNIVISLTVCIVLIYIITKNQTT